MKRKNLVLLFAAFFVGIGSAIGIQFMPGNVYVHAKLKSDPSGETHCVDTKILCDASGFGVCTVIVPVSGGSAIVRTNSKNFRPYKGADCQTQLTGTDGGGYSSVIIIDRLVE